MFCEFSAGEYYYGGTVVVIKIMVECMYYIVEIFRNGDEKRTRTIVY
jgi:hypothetical protein